MKFPCLIVLAYLAPGGLATGRAADAARPVDYAQRDTAFAPAATVAPDPKTPQLDTALQDKRVDPITIDKKPSALGDRRAAIAMQEARDKTVREKDSHRPEADERTMSAFNHRGSAITTGAEARKPELVSKYQASLTAASASNMARFPAASGATTAKINRFVFRKNALDSAAALDGTLVTPAAGGSAVQK